MSAFGFFFQTLSTVVLLGLVVAQIIKAARLEADIHWLKIRVWNLEHGVRNDDRPKDYAH